MALARNHDGPVIKLHHERLVAVGVAWSWHHEYPREDLSFSVEFLITNPGRIN